MDRYFLALRARLVGMKLAFIGVGKMGRSVLEGILAARLLASDEIGVLASSAERTWTYAEQYGVRALKAEDTSEAERVLIALQPRDFPEMAPSIAHPGSGYISIMAGVSTAVLGQRLGTRRVVRAMPNLAAVIRHSSTALYTPREAHEAGDHVFAERLFETVGEVYWLPERLFDAFTGMAASAPAYFAVLAEALADGGVRVGLPRSQSLSLAADLLVATGELLRQKHPAVIKDEVASPGGTTIYGLEALESHGARSALIDAVVCATRRGHELGEE